MNNAIVFDVGGTKIATTVISEDDGEDLLETPLIVPTPATGSTEHFIDALVEQFEILNKRFGHVVAWGAAFPGPYETSEHGQLIVQPRNIPAARGVNIEALLTARLRCPGIVDNDMKLALWGEHLIGAAVGFDDVIGIVHSTGVSSAVLQNGQIVRGRNNNAGEIGCVTVEFDASRARPCDAQDGQAFGHLEAQTRGPVLAELFFGVDRHDSVAVRGALESASEQQRQEIVDYVVPYMTPTVAAMCQITEPQRVLLHGSVAAWLGQPYALALQATLRDASESFDGDVVLSKEPLHSPLIGAADLAFMKARG